MKDAIRCWVRNLTRWAWEPEATQWAEAVHDLHGAQRYAHVKGLQLALLEELFREKQGKITRLQQYHVEHRRPLYEDLRKENPIKDAESLAQSIDVMASRAEAYRARTGKLMRISDGTVLGVPGDKPNVETGVHW